MPVVFGGRRAGWRPWARAVQGIQNGAGYVDRHVDFVGQFKHVRRTAFDCIVYLRRGRAEKPDVLKEMRPVGADLRSPPPSFVKSAIFVQEHPIEIMEREVCSDIGL